MNTFLEAVAQVGFPIAVAVFLLWKGYTQDVEYLKVLIKMNLLLETHIAEKERALDLLEAQMRALEKK